MTSYTSEAIIGRISHAVTRPTIRVIASSTRVSRFAPICGSVIAGVRKRMRAGRAPSSPAAYGRSVGQRRKAMRPDASLRRCRERGIAEVCVQVEDLRPVRHDDFRERALRIQYLLEEDILLRVAIEHD